MVNGRKLSTVRKRDVPYLRRTMGIVFQDFRLIDKMTVYDNVAFAMHIVGASDREIRKRVPYVLGLVGLEKKMDNHPAELSGGEQQRVGLARALVNNPSMIIADEPTGNVDPAMSYEIVELLTEINRRGTTVLMVTHEHDLVKRFPRRVIEIREERLWGIPARRCAMNFSSMKYLLKEGVKNVWNNRMMSFASIGVLVSCLLLTGAAVLFSANLSYAMKDIQDENVVTVYLKQEVGELEAVTLGSELKEIPNIKEIVFVSQQEALEQYTEILGPLFEGLEEDNFLPNAYRVTMEDLSLYDETVAKIKEIPQVDTLSDRSDAASKLTNLNNMVGTAGLWILIILSVVSLFIISNTIRVTMYSRRLEISIMKSVGATNWFIRVPFIVEAW